RSKNARAARIQIFVDNHDRIVIEAQKRAILAPDRLLRANKNRAYDFALLYRPSRARLFHVRRDHVTDSGKLSSAFANDADHRRHAGAAIIRNIKSGSNLDHKINNYSRIISELFLDNFHQSPAL